MTILPSLNIINYINILQFIMILKYFKIYRYQCVLLHSNCVLKRYIIQLVNLQDNYALCFLVVSQIGISLFISVNIIQSLNRYPIKINRQLLLIYNYTAMCSFINILNFMFDIFLSILINCDINSLHQLKAIY